jgi:DNA-binding response OmpR family regulator
MIHSDFMVLLVDDDHDVASFYEVLLTNEGYKVKVCHNAGQALDWWKRHHQRCGLLVLDMELPDLNGFKLYERIRSSMADCPPAMLLTAHDDPGLPRKCLEAGVDIYLDKLKDMGRFIPLARELLV